MRISRTSVLEIISQARTFEASQILPSHKTIGELADEFLENPSLQYSALLRNLEELSPHELKEIGALMWLGRGDYDDWEAALARAESAGVADTYIAGKLNLAEYLERGLDKLESTEQN